MDFDALQRQAQARHLTILGGFHPTATDGAPEGCKTLLMLGPDEPAFWPHLQGQPEWQDNNPDPVDRWSRRILTDWAQTCDAQALFPFGGKPFLPFFSWATRTGRIHASPIMLLVHDQAGLFVSFRGALAFGHHIDLPPAPPNPCLSCANQPCRTSCPVDALDGASYDVPACKSHLRAPDGAPCLTTGCLARRACPVSQKFGRLPEQSGYHMRHFLGD